MRWLKLPASTTLEFSAMVAINPAGNAVSAPPIDEPNPVETVLRTFFPQITLPGPELVHLSDGWIPQGQAYVPGTDQDLLLSTYNDDDSQVLVSLQDPASLQGELNHVVLGPPPTPDGLHGWENTAYQQAHTPDKGGGIAVDGDIVYVADSEGIYTYSLQAMQTAAPGEAVPALGFQPTDSTASYITIHDGHAYVGQFGVDPDGIGSGDYGTNPTLTRYEIDANHQLVNPGAPIQAPYYAQGVAVTEHGLLYTTSLGSNTPDNDGDDSPHALVYQPFSDFSAFQPETRPLEMLGMTISGTQVPVFHEVANLDYYAEEFNIVGDELWITYESNADKYIDNYTGNVHTPPSNTHVQRVPLDALDLSGTGVTAEQLATAANTP